MNPNKKITKLPNKLKVKKKKVPLKVPETISRNRTTKKEAIQRPAKQTRALSKGQT